MKKLLMIMGFLAVAGCTSNKPDCFGNVDCYNMYRIKRDCHNVRIMHDVIEVKGIYREELINVSACDRNTEFYYVKKPRQMSSEFFDVDYRECRATLSGCY